MASTKTKPRFEIVDNGDGTLTIYDSGRMLVDLTYKDADALVYDLGGSVGTLARSCPPVRRGALR